MRTREGCPLSRMTSKGCAIPFYTESKPLSTSLPNSNTRADMSLKMSSPTVHESDEDVQTTEQTTYLPTVEEVAVVLTFRQTIERFHEDAPSKLKWCDLSEGDIRRYVYYNIVEPAPVNMGRQTVWQLRDWVQTILEQTDSTFNLSAKQIKTLTKYNDELSSLDDTFHAKDTNLHPRNLGLLKDTGLLSMKENNRHQHKPSVWQPTEKLNRILDVKDSI